MKNHVVLCAVLLAACSRDAATSDSPVVTTIPQLPYAEAPWYAQGCPFTENATVKATGFYKDATVSYALKPPNDATHLTLNFVRCPQAVVIGSTSTGAAFLVVVTTDFGANTARIVSFVDGDSDNLPDVGSETTIKQFSSVHLYGAVYDSATATMYVVDGLNDRILRYEDSTGDKIPDATTETVFLDGAGALVTSVSAIRLQEPKEYSVEIVQRRVISGPLRLEEAHIRATDNTQDGIADQVDDVASGLPLRVSFNGYSRQGETTVELSATVNVSYEIRAGTDVLASFVATGFPQEIGLSRALGANETIVLVETGSTDPKATTTASASNSTVISHIDKPLKQRHPGDEVKFLGSGITGSETVEARLKNSTEDFVSCTVTSSTTESLTVEIPEFEVNAAATVVFKITPVTGQVFTLALVISADE